MTLQQLEYVVNLDNERHFVRAAEKCFVTQPTLTMQIKKLEEEIGLQIFDRSQKPLRPTPMGERVVMHAREILNEVSRLKSLVNDEMETLEGEYVLGVIPTLAPYVIPLFISEFADRYPEAKLVIRELQTEQIIRALGKGTVDVGLLVTPLEERSIREIPLFNEPFLLYLPEDHPLRAYSSVDARELEGDDVLVLSEGHCFREQALNVCNRVDGDEQPFKYESGSIEALKNMVKRNIGYTLVPELSITPDDKPFLKRFADPEPIREVSLVVHKSFTRERFLETLRSEILRQIPEKYARPRNYVRVKWR